MGLAWAWFTVASVWAQPANNNFASSIPLSGFSTNVSGSNSGANKESNEPSHAGNRGGASVWWNWTAPVSGPVRVTTAGSSFNTLLAVYTGTAVASLTQVAANDNMSGSQQSLLQFTASAGVNYKIVVDGYRTWGSAAQGTIQLSLAMLPTVTITTPTNNADFAVPASVIFQAAAAAPTGSVAKVEYFVGTSKIGQATSSPYEFVWSVSLLGTNAVYAVVTDSQGQTNVSVSVNVIISDPFGFSAVLVHSNAVWMYLDDGTDQGTGWVAPDFDDSKWAAGCAELGYGDNDECTLVRSNGLDGNRIITTYFRRTFPVTDLGSLTNLSLGLRRDDGAVVYLNGQGVWTNGFPDGTTDITASTLANNAGDDGYTWLVANLSPALLVEGPNVLAVEIHQTTATSTDISFALQLIGQGRSNQVFYTRLTSPANGARFIEPPNLTLGATAQDPQGTITVVEFFANGAKLGESEVAPYTLLWKAPALGNYQLTSVATDNRGISVTSAVVNITLTTNTPPTVAVTSPANGARLAAPSSLTVTASATDSDGTVSKVEVFADDTKLGETAASPASVVWLNPPLGNYLLRAVATDERGLSATSAPVSITVTTNTPPTVALTNPLDHATFTALATLTLGASAADVDGPVTRLEFFSGSSKIGESTTSPYALTWGNVGAGQYVLTAVATDAGGLRATSAPVNVSVLLAVGSQWVAFNDQYQGPASSPYDTFYTAPNLGTASGPLLNINGGGALPVVLTVTNTTAPDTAGTMAAPAAGTPAYNLFNAYIDWTTATSGNNGFHVYPGNLVGYGFSGLDPSRQYRFSATSMRGGAPDGGGTDNYYSNRWTQVELVGALSSTPTHSANVITSNQFPASLSGSQAAFNAGVNNTATTGDIVQWEGIVPAANGTFTVLSSQYLGAFPGGVGVNALYTFGLTALRLEELFVGSVAQILTPASNTLFALPANVAISATAVSTSPITNLAFYANGQELGARANSPYTFTWSNAPAGTYQLTVVAWDQAGLATTSAPVAIAVVSNGPPLVQLTGPADGTAMLAPANPTLQASASDDYGVTTVAFFNGSAQLGLVSSPPYTLPWTGVTAGAYSLTAVATDRFGLAATSAVVHLTVTNDLPPVVTLTSPTNHATLDASVTDINVPLLATASDPDGVVAKVEFFADAAKVGESTTAPFGAVWNVSAGGGYQLLAVATDTLGMKGTSAVVNVTVLGNVPPLVALTNPANNATFGAPASLALSATASDSDGTVTNVEFYAGSLLLGRALTSPYTVLWTNVPAASYTLTAVAVDNRGTRATSSPVNISVVAAMVSQWTAYNDHNRGSATAPNVSTYSVASVGVNVGGPLTNFDTGQLLSPNQVGVVISVAGSISGSSGGSTAPTAGTPADQLFTGKVTWTDSAFYFGSGSAASSSELRITFTNLTAGRRYGFRGTAVRGNAYTGRWGLATLAGVSSATPAHVQGSGSPGIITNGWAPYGSTLAPDLQAAWNCGANLVGDVVGWDDIVPAGNSFSVISSNYLAVSSTSPLGALENTYSYAINAFRLEEFAVGGPLVQITTPKNNGLVVLPTNLVLSAMVSGFGGVVTNVSYYSGTAKLGEVVSSPYDLAWASLVPGSYTLTAVARDNTGLAVTSAVVRFTAQNNVAPTVAITSPADSTVFSAPADLTLEVSATDSDGAITNLDLLANGTLLNRVSRGTMTYLWSTVGVGNYNLSALATDDHGAVATSSVVRAYVIASTAPTVDSFDPLPGALLSNLASVTVNFSQPVDGVQAADLLVNGQPATGVMGSGASYTFSFPSVPEGTVAVNWALNHGVSNRLVPPRAFLGTLTNEMAQYTLLDTVPPTVTRIEPLPGSTLPSFSRVEVTFSEPVAGVNQSALRMNGLEATKVSGSLAGPYRFEFTPASNGPVQLAWATTAGIHDLAAAPNSLLAAAWGYTVDTARAETNVVISEIMYHPAPEMPEDARQEWVELFNQGGEPVNLQGWQFTKGVDYAFSNLILPAGGYLVVAANATAFRARYPGVTNVVGDWTGQLGNNGDELHLRNAAGDLINGVSLASEGDWGRRLKGRGERQVGSLSRNGTTVTAYIFGHGFHNSDQVRIYGADPTNYNGVFTIANCTASTFTYTISGSPAAATGLIICRRLTDTANSGATFTGWSWSCLADGLGRSMELMNPALPNGSGQNWAASSVLYGTPGRANSLATNNVAPLVLNVRHFPLVPRSTNTITVTARVLDESPNPALVALIYRNATASPAGSWSTNAMFDDGLHGDGLAGDGVFGVRVAPQANLTILEFFVAAADAQGNRRTWPAPALDTYDSPVQDANALLQVDDTIYTGTQPVHRFIMTEADRAELRREHDNDSNDANTLSAIMNLTFLSTDGIDSACVYRSGLRNRGAGSRTFWPMNYAARFPNDQLWKGRGALNFHSAAGHSYLAGCELAYEARIQCEAARVVQIRVNGLNLAVNPGSSGSEMFGAYIEMEGADSGYAASHFPDDPNGNIYRGSKYPWDAGLNWIGTDTNAYYGQRGSGYYKSSNNSQNDWTDLVNLCAVLNSVNSGTVDYRANATNDAGYAAAVRQAVNVEDWMRHFAAYALMGSGETAFETGYGDDYMTYRGVQDPRFVLLAHDFDAVLGMGDGPQPATAHLFSMCPFMNSSGISWRTDHNATVLNRFMTNAFFAPVYYRTLSELLDTTFQPANVSLVLDRVLGDWVPSSYITSMKTYGTNRYNYVRSVIPTNLTVLHTLTTANGYPTTANLTMSLGGAAHAFKTRSVKVNGSPTVWTPWRATWTNTSVGLQPGLNELLVQAFDETGAEVNRSTLEVWCSNGAGTTVAGGTLAVNTAWLAASGPYRITGSLTIPAGVTLTIQAGTTVYLDSAVNLTIASGGRLVAEGTDTQRITFSRVPGTSTSWGGITINGGAGTPETRLTYAHLEFNSTTAIHSSGGTVFLDHLTFGTTGYQYMSLDSSSFVVSDCVFPSPTASFEPLHGTGGIKAGGRGLFLRNFFAAITGYNDVIDFTGGNRPSQPIVQFINNVFMGSGDDFLDLDSTDAWVEGNIFLHTHKNGSPDTSSGVSGGNDNGSTSEVTLVGNIFYDCDQAAMAKQGNFFTLLNNTILHLTHQGGTDTDGAVVCLADEGTTEGAGMYLEGNIVWDVEKLVRNQTASLVTFTNNTLSLPWTGPGGGNTLSDPRFKHVPTLAETTNFTSWAQAQVMKEWLSLAADSPARAAGPNGLDRGAAVPRGVSLSGEPAGATARTDATLVVGGNWTGNGLPVAGWPEGSGFTAYKWRLDGRGWSLETPMGTPIQLSGLSVGQHRVEVAGRNDAGLYQDDASLGADAAVTASQVWTVLPATLALRLSELLASNQRAVPLNGGYPDLVELRNLGATALDLAGVSLTDDLTDPRKFVFPPGRSLAAGEYLVLLADNDQQAPGTHLGFNLNKDGGALHLFGPTGGLLDSVEYGLQISDLAIARLADGNWGLALPTFGAANVAAPLGDSHQVKINEWLTHGVSPVPYDFIELFNAGSLPVALGGWSLTDEPVGAPRHDRLPALSYIAGAGYTVLVADGAAGADHLNFRLSGDRGLLGLFDEDVTLIDLVSYGPQFQDVSQGRSPNGASTFAFFALPTPGAPNHAPPSASGGQLVLNEVLTKSLPGPNAITNLDGGTPEWIELYNPTTNTLNLADLSLSDTLADPRRWVFPSGVSLAAGGYLVVVCDPSLPPSTNAGALLNTGFGLKVNGGEVYLFDKGLGGSQLDGIAYGVQAPNYSIGRVPSGGTNWLLNIPSPRGLNLATALGDRSQLRLNEWMANPSQGDDWFEIFNPNPQPVDLSGLYLTDDLRTPASRLKFKIAPLSFIGTGLYGYARFWADDALTAGPDHCAFGLKASGESLGLYLAGDVRIDSLTFAAQALGVSEGGLPDGSTNWARFPETPTPGEANYLPLTNVVVNEVLTAIPPGAPLEQAIELRNLTTQPVNVGGWYLSNMRHSLKKFRLPTNTVLAPGGFVVFYENQFNYDPRDPSSFRFDALQGDNVYLSAADTNGTLTGYRFAQDLGPAQPGVSFGRYVNSVGNVDFPPQSQTTFGNDAVESVPDFRLGTGASNAYPKVGPVMVSEVMYHPAELAGVDNARDEYVELHNAGTVLVSLFDPAQPANTWRLRSAVDFNFPTNVTLAPNGYLVVVGFDPANDPTNLAAFRVQYQVTGPVAILGPYSGKLANNDAKVELYQPGVPTNGVTPYLLVERVHYYDSYPWPAGSDGLGASLNRVSFAGYANDPTNWVDAPPSPGSPSVPSITTQPASQEVPVGATFTLSVGAWGLGPLTYQWRFNGSPILGATGSVFSLSNVPPEAEGNYDVLVSNPNGTVLSMLAVLTINSPVSDVDGDGIPDAWMIQYFGHAEGQPGDRSLASQDADGDGLNNYQEYLAGTNPRDPASVLRLENVQRVGSNVVFVFQALAHHSYTVDYGPSLPVRSNTTILNIAAEATNRTLLITIPENGASGFYRVRTP